MPAVAAASDHRTKADLFAIQAANLVHSILLENGLAPTPLELEITEGILINDASRAFRFSLV